MVIGVITIEIYLSGSGSLKNKRQVLKSLIDRIKQRFNVSVSEVGFQDLWQRSVIGVACVGNAADYVNSTLDKVIVTARRSPMMEVIQTDLQIL